VLILRFVDYTPWQGIECGLVSVQHGVEVPLGRAEAAVAEAFFDHLEVGAAG
jgi:hypothetical protein